jgi:hypothetical protein
MFVHRDARLGPSRAGVTQLAQRTGTRDLSQMCAQKRSQDNRSHTHVSDRLP